MSSALELLALPGLPMVREGDDIAALIAAALDGRELRAGDVVVVAQKIVSKAEGRTVDLATITPSAEAVTRVWWKSSWESPPAWCGLGRT